MELSSFPEEIICQFLAYISDVDHIINLMTVSSSILRLTGVSITHLVSTKCRDIPVSWITRFKELRATGNPIIIHLHSDQIGLLASVPNLLKANFEVSGIGHASIILDLLAALEVNRKVPNLDLKVSTGTIPLILQGDRYFALEGLSQGAYTQQKLPGLRSVSIPPIMRRGLTSPMLLFSNRFKYFTERAEFGLLDPSLPPSKNNPSITPRIRAIGRSGAADRIMIENILKLYGQYHRILCGSFLVSDQLCKDTFEEIINDFDITTTANRITLYKSRILREYNLPQLLPDEEYMSIDRQISNILFVYSEYRDFYHEDGSISKSRF